MDSINDLPVPEAEAQEQSLSLQKLIRQEIHAQGGWIGFDRFMARALFTPDLGYYSGASRKFGPEGDFVTAPEITPLFGRALARQVAQILDAGCPGVLEVGAGSGMLAADLLLELEHMGRLPACYEILELSGELRARQAETLRKQAPHLLERVVWLDRLPEQFEGCVLANEVIDVMPVQLVVWRDGQIFERGVVLDGEQFGWADRLAQGSLLEAAQALPIGTVETGEYVSEICLPARAWVKEWALRLRRGALILIDYGYPQSEYYLPSRSQGTVQCYYRHRAHTELLQWPGLNDITAFVDFTALADAAHTAGLTVEGYTSQARFLTDCGLLGLLEEMGPTDEAAYLRAAHAALRLIAPHEMGELFKVLMLTRGLESVRLLGLISGDRSGML